MEPKDFLGVPFKEGDYLIRATIDRNLPAMELVVVGQLNLGSSLCQADLLVVRSYDAARVGESFRGVFPLETATDRVRFERLMYVKVAAP